ncbi:MAG: hypothetical protein ACFFG0_41220 [Candidatus Thorarchaeota archaeon]
MNIIGVSGLAGSGKDTVADIMLENEGFVKVSLADPLKRFMMDLWEFTPEQLFGVSKHRNDPDYRYPIGSDGFLSPRKALQHLGTEGVRAIDQDAWIRYAIKTAKTLLGNTCAYYSPIDGLNYISQDYPISSWKTKCITKAVIIGGVRFINEFKCIKENGGKLIKVIRPGAGLKGCFANHPSETELSTIQDSEFDLVIQNTGTIDDLRKVVQEFVNNYIS